MAGDELFTSIQTLASEYRDAPLPSKSFIVPKLCGTTIFPAISIPSFATTITDTKKKLYEEYLLACEKGLLVPKHNPAVEKGAMHDVYVMENGVFHQQVLDALPTLKEFVATNSSFRHHHFACGTGSMYFRTLSPGTVTLSEQGGDTNCCVQLRIPIAMDPASTTIFFNTGESCVCDASVVFDNTVPSFTVNDESHTTFVMLVIQVWHPTVICDRRNVVYLTRLFSSYSGYGSVSSSPYFDDDIYDMYKRDPQCVAPMMVLSSAAFDALGIPFDAVRNVISLAVKEPLPPPLLRTCSNGKPQLIKYVMLGDSGIGKTSLSYRFADDSYTEHFIPTIGVDFKLNHVQLELQRDEADSLRKKDTYTFRLQLWDLSGQPRFHAIVISYFRGAQGMLLCFNVQSRTSFLNLRRGWMADIDRLGVEGAPVIVVGLKADEGCVREVTPEEGRRFADDHGCPYMECSAKDNKNVNEVFGMLTQQTIQFLKIQPDKVWPPYEEEEQRKKKCLIA